MTGLDVLRGTVAGGSALIVGAVAVVFVLYLQRTVRGGHGRLLVRHVAEVSLGVGVFVAALGVGVWDTVGAPSGPPVSRLIAYLVAELLLLVALLDVGQHLRGKDQP